MSNNFQFYSRLEHLQERYLRNKSGQEALLEVINKAEVSEQVYNSNAIEKSSLTLEETEKILQQIDLKRFISEKELLSAKNLSRAITHVYENAETIPFSIETIQQLHKTLFTNADEEITGAFRTDKDNLETGIHTIPPPDQVLPLLEEAISVYFITDQEHLLCKISKFLLTFNSIHPFKEGNGKIGRVLLNLLLIKRLHVPVNIKFADRNKYHDALMCYGLRGETKPMEQILGLALSSSYHKRLVYLKGTQAQRLKDYALTSSFSYPNLINKAKRQTIEAFWERGMWKIGVDS